MTDELCSLGDCVEIAAEFADAVYLRSNRRPDDLFKVDRDEWRKHKAEVKAGKYDDENDAPVDWPDRCERAAEAAERQAGRKVAAYYGFNDLAAWLRHQPPHVVEAIGRALMGAASG